LKILVAGDWRSELHEAAIFGALQQLGHQVEKFSWHQYFAPSKRESQLGFLLDLTNKKFQNKYLVGPILSRINDDLVEQTKRFRPDLLFIYRGTHITSVTLQRIKRLCPECIIAGYNNDDPFATGHPRWLWRHFIDAVPCYDVIFAYRQHNIEEFRQIGAKRVQLLRSWYRPASNHPVELSPDDRARFGCDVVFVGHFEADERTDYIEEIVRQGFNFRIFGPDHDWDRITTRSPILQRFHPVKPVWGADYNKALCGAKIALCFFSSLNRDTYTRRTFEIPASGTLMLSQYSDDVATMFKEGEEADFFRTKEELVRKIAFYLTNDSVRHRVAAAGHRRVIADNHDVVSRMQQTLQYLSESYGSGSRVVA